MQRSFRLDGLRVSVSRPPVWRTRMWREWCFLRAVVLRLWPRLLVFAVVLVVGANVFLAVDTQRKHTIASAVFYTWSLVFGEPPESFPEEWPLQALFFVVPVLGLTVIIEAVVELAFMVRDRRKNERVWCRIMALAMRDHVVLVGLGRLGFRTFLLLRRLGIQVAVLERDPQNQFLEDVRRDGSPLFIGDARREAFLEDANVAQARAVVLATTDDLANLEMALDARKQNPKIRVVLRMFDQNMADKVRDGFNIHLAMSQAAISAPSFAMAALEPSIVGSAVVGERLIVMVRWVVREGGPLCGKTVGEVNREMGVGVLELARAESEARLLPSGEVGLEAGDRLIVQGEYETVTKLRGVTQASGGS
ncbi:MAG: potassium channel protein [Phycisphaeraceae bacterium]|nr:potassium channel protein [Phycisphaeraceae bacterium]